MSKKYKLSASLYGHSLDVRSVSVLSDNSILSGSRDKTAKFWKGNGLNTGYSEVMSYKDQKHFVITVLYLEPSENFPDGLVLTGGNDNTIYIYKPAEPFAIQTLKEHTNAVSCLSRGTTPNSFLSGSWDNNAKLWDISKAQSSRITFSGHAAAIWAVLQLQDLRVVTGSGDKTIIIWESTGQKLNTLKDHTDCVRGLLDFPESQHFVSVSNDASIRVWSYSGENTDTYYGHTNFIYSIARCKANGENCFVTSDEDRTVRVWQNGQNTETFQLPAQSVWSVACLSNGDIVTGSSDGVIRVFSRDEARVADESSLNKFNEEVTALTKQSVQEIGGYKVADLPGPEALYEPGRKEGQMRIIREGGGVVAYTWKTDHWEKVGDVLGSTDKDKNDKTMFEGQAYDFVFSVDVEDGKPPLKLPYNRGQDPYQAANQFLTRNVLPNAYLEQVVDFILKNSKENFVPQTAEYVDPFTGGSRYTPGSAPNQGGFTGANVDPLTGGNSYSTSLGNRGPANVPSAGANFDPFTGGSSYNTSVNQNQNVSYFPVKTYKIFEMGDPNVILGKLKEFNKKSGHGNGTVDEAFLDQLIKICSGPPDDPNSFDVLFKLLDWPDELVFPVLDVVRLSVRVQKNNEIICTANNGVLLRKLMNFVSETCKIPNNLIVALRTLCNLFQHEAGEELVFENRFDIVENITALGTLNKNAQIALSTLLMNLVVVALRKQDDLSISVLADVLLDILTKLSDPEAQFRGYVALGTLLATPNVKKIEELKAKVKANVTFLDSLQLNMLACQGDLEIKRRNCAKQLQVILNVNF